jgi:predicted esterase
VSRSIRTTTNRDGTTVARVRAASPDEPTWLLLHGSDGHETDLIPLAGRLAPHAALVAPRGTVPTPFGFAHAHRRADRTIDGDDLRVRAAALATAVEAERRGALPGDRLILLGFSNGAVMAAALVESRPDLFSAAVLIRAEPPYPAGTAEPTQPTPPTQATQPTPPTQATPPTRSLPVLVLDGRDDARRSPDDGRRVADRLRALDHRVSHVVVPAEHGITAEDERAIGAWLSAITDTDENAVSASE